MSLTFFANKIFFQVVKAPAVFTERSQDSPLNTGGCPRGAPLRHFDGSVLVCGSGPSDFACPNSHVCLPDERRQSHICCIRGI